MTSTMTERPAWRCKPLVELLFLVPLVVGCAAPDSGANPKTLLLDPASPDAGGAGRPSPPFVHGRNAARPENGKF